MTDILEPWLSKIIESGANNVPSTAFPCYDDPTVDLPRQKYVTSSEIGYCERKIWFDKRALRNVPSRGTKVIPANRGVMERGKMAERWIVEALEHADTVVDFLYMGANQRSFYDGLQAGTPDGLAVLPDQRALVIEIKSIDPRTNTNYLPKPYHRDQITQNIDLLLACTDYDIVGGALIYIDCADYDKRYEHPIKFNTVRAEELEAKAERILEAKAASDLRPEGMFNDQCRFCDHKVACSAANREMEVTNVPNEQSQRFFAR